MGRILVHRLQVVNKNIIGSGNGLSAFSLIFLLKYDYFKSRKLDYLENCICKMARVLPEPQCGERLIKYVPIIWTEDYIFKTK